MSAYEYAHITLHHVRFWMAVGLRYPAADIRPITLR